MSGDRQAARLVSRALVVLALMLLSCAAAALLTPRQYLAALNRDLRLEQAIPPSFGDWRQEAMAPGGVVNPQGQALIKALYSQTLSRVYVDAQGQRMMLSIAYGGEQAHEIELHRPEVCYTAQGFALEEGPRGTLHDAGRDIPIKRLMARQEGRPEPITYWMRVGDDLTVSGLSQQLSRVRQGLHGRVPDGVLFRVSSISPDAASAYPQQDRFVTALLAAVDSRTRRFLIGPVDGGEESP